MKLLSAAEMRELDRRTIEEIGIPGMVLMENAGREAARRLEHHFGELFPGPVLILAGKGNNGGDGYVIARHLLNRGWTVRTVVLSPAGGITGDAAVNLEILRRCGGNLAFVTSGGELEEVLGASREYPLLVDALLGTGLTSEVRGLYAQAIDWINTARGAVAAVDIPSGVDATSGRILGRAVRAALTVTFACAKIGLAIHPGADCVGVLEVADIGIPDPLIRAAGGNHLLVEEGEAARWVPLRPATGHKGTFGHVLVVGGSTGKTGAAAMAAEGALRSGAGLVTLACPEGEQPVLAAKLTEAMTVPLPSGGALGRSALEPLQEVWEGKSVLAVGPGLGQGEESFALVREIVSRCPVPLVLDADGINAMTGETALLRRRKAQHLILTPHPGEMARLLGRPVAEVENNRIGIARQFAQEHGVVLVLKGARTIIALPEGEVRINSSGNPGMASGGMGDVLTGIVAGLLAQGMAPGDAAALAVYLHGMAADRLQARLGQAGMIATDLLREIPAARRTLSTDTA